MAAPKKHSDELRVRRLDRRRLRQRARPSFVDTIKAELIADRVWQTRSQLELAIVAYLGWFNDARLHESIGDIPPAEFEPLHTARFETSTTTIEIYAGCSSATTWGWTTSVTP